jgi:ribosome-associated protein
MTERPPQSNPAGEEKPAGEGNPAAQGKQAVEGKLDSEALARRLAELADAKGATEIVSLDMRKLVSYTDFLTICTARNERQARAIVDEVKLRLKKEWELLPGGIEGEGPAGWIVVDYLDCVLHVFTEEARQRYQLEELWHEAPRLEPELPQDGVRRHLYGAAHG